MKLLISLITLLFSCLFSHGQTNTSMDSIVNSLYLEINSACCVQSRYIGCFGHESQLFAKVDSLKSIVGMESFMAYINDTSVNLKYYAFIEILALDDDLAFEKLNSLVQNSDTVNFEFAGNYGGVARLSELLTGEYLNFIYAKYYRGGSGVYNARYYAFGKKDKRAYRQKRSTANMFANANGLSVEWIETNARRRSLK